jgi:hypothetical protein
MKECQLKRAIATQTGQGETFEKGSSSSSSNLGIVTFATAATIVVPKQ